MVEHLDLNDRTHAVPTRRSSDLFGHRLGEAGLLGSMGTICDWFDNSVAESFFATLQTELLDRSTWPTREVLANAIFSFVTAPTTRAGVTRRSATSAPPTTRPSTH